MISSKWLVVVVCCDVQAKAGFRGLLLEKKLAVATADLEKKESQLTEV